MTFSVVAIIAAIIAIAIGAITNHATWHRLLS